jgi:probable HAF family extracellular repeat protein
MRTVPRLFTRAVGPILAAALLSATAVFGQAVKTAATTAQSPPARTPNLVSEGTLCAVVAATSVARPTAATAQKHPATEGTARYRIVDLGQALQNAEALGMGLNLAGDVAGWTETGDGACAAVVWHGAKRIPLGHLPNERQSFAVSINGRGQAVGLSREPDDIRYNHAFLAQNGRMRDLGALGGKYSIARDINERGQVVGEAITAAGNRHAFLWANGAMHDLGALRGGDTSAAAGINDAGRIVGGGNIEPNGKDHAFLWSEGVYTDLGLLPGGSFSYAKAINRAGQIVGWADNGEGDIRPVLWDGKTMRDLGTLGDSPSSAWSLNNRGQVVGMAATNLQRQHAFLWEGGRLTDLNALIPPNTGWLLRAAFRINDAGMIAGLGWKDGRMHGFLLVPLIPQPAGVPHSQPEHSVAPARQPSAAQKPVSPSASHMGALTLLDLEGRAIQPLNGGNRLATVFLFLAHDCPIANAYAPEINRLAADYTPRGVVFHPVYVEDDLSAAAERRHALAHGFTCRALRDPFHLLVARLHATVTPEAVVVTSAGDAFYQGRIDNRVQDYGKMQHQASVSDLRDALDALLTHRRPAQQRTRAIGCIIPPVRPHIR